MLGITIYLIGAFIGIWYMLIGGIVDFVDVIKATETDSMQLAIGVAKIIFCFVPIKIGTIIGVIIAD